MFGDVLLSLADVSAEIVQTKSALLHQVIEVGNLVRLVLFLPLDQFVRHLI